MLNQILATPLPQHFLAVPAFVTDHFNWILGGAVVLIGILVGLKDLLRFSVVRAWAISKVSFDESIRRRVLLITPVAILGVIIVSQLQHPVDAQDAVRQTIKVALFATGMVVVIATIIMACTNLPKEIDNRVIYTVVTKPTTRLEIVIGKVVGFAKVSALLLLIMGLFTWGYVTFRAVNYRHDVEAMLADNKVDESSRATYQHYAKAGLLSAKKYEQADALQVLARVPAEGESERWVYGNGEQDILIPFDVQPGEFVGPGYESITPDSGAVVVANLDFVQRALTPEELKQAGGSEGDELGIAAETEHGPLAPGASTKPAERPAPKVTIQFLDRNRYSLVDGRQVNGGKPETFPPAKGQAVEARLTGDAMAALARAGRFYIQITGLSPGTEYGIRIPSKPEESPVQILVPGRDPGKANVIVPVVPGTEAAAAGMTWTFRGRLGTDGQQLRGGEPGKVAAAVYSFRGAEVNPRGDGTVPLEFTTGIEKTVDEPSDVDVPTKVTVSVVDPKTGKANGTVAITPESRRTTYFNVPAAWLGGGDFDLVVNNETPGHWTAVLTDSLQMVVQDQPFAVNLAKSLIVMWLLSVLVVVVSVFTSTFLSWPIAIVLTLVILLGKWGVDELGDAAGSGIGNQVATDLGFRDVGTAKVVSTSVEALTRFLNTVSSVLPDIGAFGGTESVERGVAIPPADVYNALVVLVAFGVPLTLAAYVILRNKEVAP